MEKLLFLFPRKSDLTRDEFFDHYREVHAPLGMELTKTMVHYAVNLRDGADGAPDGVDAFTETWTDSVADFMNPEKSFATRDDAQRLMNDHNSFIGDPYDVYVIDERVRKGPERATPTGRRTPGTRLIVAASDHAVLDRLASLVERDDVIRYVENDVQQALMTDAFGPVQAFVAINVVDGGATASQVDEIVGDRGSVYQVSEYVQK